MKAAMIPIKGTWRSPRLLLVRETAAARTATVRTQQIAEITILRKPSGICMGFGEYNI
jgi:hypothetical protein